MYTKQPDFFFLAERLREYARLKDENGAQGVEKVLKETETLVRAQIEKLRALAEDEKMRACEPDELSAIRALRPSGPRKMASALPKDYESRLAGAFYARMAGCTLGAPVEGWSVKAMEKWAKYIGDAFPPEHYWGKTKSPYELRYEKSDCIEYTREGMKKTPVDDDITYTLLGLLIAEDSGVDFTVEDVGKAWLKYLPVACTAEEITLENLRAGIPAARAAEKDNPYIQWIGADIRSDPFAYMAPAWPERAAKLAYTDAMISHRRNGVYGEMYFAAAQSAAFAVDDVMEALRIGLTEIPENCSLARDVRWALDIAPTVKDYRHARALVDERFDGMSAVHTNNNACLTIFALALGGDDVTKVIGNAVAMGLDNDCTAATAGSIAGAVAGVGRVDARWTAPFRDIVDSYMTGVGEMRISDVLARFKRLAEEIYKGV